MKKVLILLVFFYLSCDITENRFIILNNQSNTQIISFVSKTDIDNLENISEMDFANDIKVNDYGTINPVRTKWEDYIENCEDKKIRLYIISNDSIKKYGWDTIYKKKIYNKKYLLEIKDLEKLNWEITFRQ